MIGRVLFKPYISPCGSSKRLQVGGSCYHNECSILAYFLCFLRISEINLTCPCWTASTVNVGIGGRKNPHNGIWCGVLDLSIVDLPMSLNIKRASPVVLGQDEILCWRKLKSQCKWRLGGNFCIYHVHSTSYPYDQSRILGILDFIVFLAMDEEPYLHRFLLVRDMKKLTFHDFNHLFVYGWPHTEKKQGVEA